jgi:transposase
VKGKNMALTHSERQSRRGKMAAFVKKSGSIAAAAKEFGVTLTTVRSACRECGVVVASQVVQRASRVFAVIAGLQRGEPAADIAERFSISKQRVHRIKQLCKEHGVVLKRGR